MFDSAYSLLSSAKKIVVIQGENPDGDSLGSALALEEILGDAGTEVVLYCAIDMPKYLGYITGWDRVSKDFPYDADAAVIVDTSSEALLMKALEVRGVRAFLESHPVLVIDHHQASDDKLPFPHESLLDDTAVATTEVIYRMAVDKGLAINPTAAEQLFIGIQSDSLGLTTQNTTAASYEAAAALVGLGAHPSDIESRRREYMKKPADILAYKGELIGRIEYHLEGILATVHIPWADIEEYSDRYNPSILVLDEMRLVDSVKIAVAIKTYPDGKLTGKIRANVPIAHHVAGFFGGGGHEYSAGFKVFEAYDTVMNELIDAVNRAVVEYESAIS